MVLNNYLTAIILTVFISTVEINGASIPSADSRVSCIQNLDDFESNGWQYGSSPNMLYANHSRDLPSPVSALEGTGIFYFVQEKDGGSNDSTLSIRRNYEGYMEIEPIYLYVKYYGHVATNSSKVSAHPSAGPLVIEELTLTENFTWGESLIQIQPFYLSYFYLGVMGFNFDMGDILLVDELIIVQGMAIENINQVKELCPLQLKSSDA